MKKDDVSKKEEMAKYEVENISFAKICGSLLTTKTNKQRDKNNFEKTDEKMEMGIKRLEQR